MYAIRASENPKRVEITINGVLDDSEMVRCISQSSAIAEAGEAKYILADLRGAERCGLDRDLVVAALHAGATLDLKVAVVTSERVSQITARILKRAGLSENRARTFSSLSEAEQWLTMSAPQRELGGTELRHIDHAAAIMAPVKRKQSKKSRRKSVA